MVCFTLIGEEFNDKTSNNTNNSNELSDLPRDKDGNDLVLPPMPTITHTRGPSLTESRTLGNLF